MNNEVPEDQSPYGNDALFAETSENRNEETKFDNKTSTPNM